MKKVIYFILLVFVIAACDKKKYPPSVIEGEASYFTSLRVNGAPFELKAGFEDYYMYSSFKQDSNNIYNYIAELTKKDCKNCPLGLKIQINDSRVSAVNGDMIIDSAIHVGRYPFYRHNSATYQVSFSPSFNRIAQNGDYQWNFGDGQTTTGMYPQHTYTTAGNYNVCLSVKGSNSCISSLCNTVKINSAAFNAFITGTGTSGSTMSFKPTVVNGKAPLEYLWSFGDGKTINAESPIHTYAFPGSYAVSLKVKDANGDTTTALYNAVTLNDISSCATNYSISSILTASTLNELFGKTIITWTDEHGVRYSSSKGDQPSTSFFEILSIENNEANEKGEATKKIKVRFDCRLFNGSTSVHIENAEATVCVAYK